MKTNVFDLGPQRKCFATGATLNRQWRRDRLNELRDLFRSGSARIIEAVREDMGRPATEAYVSEIAPVRAEIALALQCLDRWMRPVRVATPLLNMPATSFHVSRPYGVGLIIGPWNYPAGLILTPLVSALAAGNCAIVKPSEYAPASASALEELISRHFDPAHVRCVTGGKRESAGLIAAGPDFVFFTGGGSAGTSIGRACGERLIPMVLELGGCNPVIIDSLDNLRVAARRIAWGKFFNAGQTCLAPNVCYVPRSLKDAFMREMRAAIHLFYGSDPWQSADFGRIINAMHFQRLAKLMQSAGRVLEGGNLSKTERYIAPTLVDAVPGVNPLLEQEIFGPILPLVWIDSLGEALEDIARRPAPLMVYLFTQDKLAVDRTRMQTRSGALCVNGTIHGAISTHLPFGGVGSSGVGRYHGKAGFDAFSYRRAEMHKKLFPDWSFVYPPYKAPLWIVRTAMRFLLKPL